MENVEECSWIFVHTKWDKLRRMPTPDKGFEERFREYIYKKINFDLMSDIRDTGFGLSYSTLSDVPHELDVICTKDKSLYVFELKNYEVSDITKEIIFTFLGKVIDFYFKNVDTLSNYKITMLFVTINKNVDDSIRKLCIAFGIKLIEPSLITLNTIEYFARDLYEKEEASEDKLKVENLIGNIGLLKESCDYSYSDIFSYKDGKIQIEQALLITNPPKILSEIKECNSLFNIAIQKWKSKRS